ncbi:SCO1860 family LAETG-anchored protein [Streptomyces sp. HB2AG]|uniref:SCO1860 family LAETG-anchored protein n=1 Tax=Streptomyces sp. HB2AG TaxID=2983400 RepID=UPI0022AA1A7D|nr:SCO1860 family LAETG-anchored protein [Streptomyces sp. HB2AG]MCZ2526103.1 LPXTG cell wall anchor domain-containing protein [Streptomyces sp. HB2AG]
MYKNVFGVLTAGALVFVPVSPAHAAGSEGAAGKASASTLQADLDVELLNKGIQVPLDVSLNRVDAPETSANSLLKAEVQGMHRGGTFTMVSAKVATTRATAEKGVSEGYSNLVDAKVHLPGLPLTPLLRIKEATSTATCETGGKPKASANLLGDVVVLGKKVSLSTAGPTTVDVPGVGKVVLELSKTSTTTDTAAASALELNVDVDPLELNIAEVTGKVALVTASCKTGGGTTGGTGGSTGGSGGSTGSTGGSGGSTGSTGGSGGSTGSTGGNGGSTGGSTGGSGGSTGGSDAGTTTGGSTGGDSGGDTGSKTSGGSSGGNEPGPQTGDGPGGNLAETGSSSGTPYVAAGAGALVVAGGAALYLVRRRKGAQADA